MTKKTTNNRTVNRELVNTWELLTDIKRQYSDSDNGLSDEGELIINYINGLDSFSKDVFYLYAEYHSYRAVAEETNRGKDVISQIINRIKKDIKNKKHII